jgi:hypothetical protein
MKTDLPAKSFVGIGAGGIVALFVAMQKRVQP